MQLVKGTDDVVKSWSNVANVTVKNTQLFVRVFARNSFKPFVGPILTIIAFSCTVQRNGPCLFEGSNAAKPPTTKTSAKIKAHISEDSANLHTTACNACDRKQAHAAPRRPRACPRHRPGRRVGQSLVRQQHHRPALRLQGPA